MAVFGLIVERNNSIVYLFVKQIRSKMLNSHFFKNPFRAALKTYSVPYDGVERALLVISIVPLYPNLLPFLAMATAGVWIIFGLFWVTYLGIVLTATGWLVRSRYFFSFFARSGLKNMGYKKMLRTIKADEIVDMVLLTEEENGTAGSIEIFRETEK